MRTEFTDSLEMAPPFYDPLPQIDQLEQRDWTLVRLVVCVAMAVFALALATQLMA
jgi:hypothetical protein